MAALVLGLIGVYLWSNAKKQQIRYILSKFKNSFLPFIVKPKSHSLQLCSPEIGLDRVTPTQGKDCGVSHDSNQGFKINFSLWFGLEEMLRGICLTEVKDSLNWREG